MWDNINMWEVIYNFLLVMQDLSVWVGTYIMPVIKGVMDGILVVLEFIINLIPV